MLDEGRGTASSYDEASATADAPSADLPARALRDALGMRMPPARGADGEHDSALAMSALASVLALAEERRPPLARAGAPAQHRRAHSTAGGPLRLSDLELLRELGEGSFAQVVECRRRCQPRPAFALKVMHKGSLLSAGLQSNALAEKAALAACRSPHVVTLYYALADAEHWCMLLELCPRGDLHAAIERRGPASARAATWLCAEAAAGLAHLHARGWAHGDVKPENIGLCAAGHAKLLDLGTARRLDGRDAAPHAGTASAAADGEGRRAQRTAGTAAYVAPEVARGESDGGEAADLWSLGCVLYYCLTGASPFARETEYLTLSAAANGHFAWPDGAQPPPAECDAAVRLLLCAQPTVRLALGRRCGAGGGGGWLGALGELPAFAALPAPPDGLHALQPPPLQPPPLHGLQPPPLHDRLRADGNRDLEPSHTPARLAPPAAMAMSGESGDGGCAHVPGGGGGGGAGIPAATAARCTRPRRHSSVSLTL